MSPSNDWHTNTIQYQTFTAPIIQQPPSSQSIDNKSKQNETKEKEESSAQQVIFIFPLFFSLRKKIKKHIVPSFIILF